MSQVSRSYLVHIQFYATPRFLEVYHKPISTTEYRTRTRNRISLSSIRLDADPTRILVAQQIIHNFKALVLVRKINRSYIHHTLELALCMVPQESEHGNDTGGADVQREFVLEHGELLHELGQRLHKVRAVLMQ